MAGALTATLCVGSLPNTRRHGGSLIEQAVAANAALFQHAGVIGPESFVTGGPPGPAHRNVEPGQRRSPRPIPLPRSHHQSGSQLPVDAPLGLYADATHRSTDLALAPGDRLVGVTDGMLEPDASPLNLVAEIDRPRDCTLGRRPVG